MNDMVLGKVPIHTLFPIKKEITVKDDAFYEIRAKYECSPIEKVVREVQINGDPDWWRWEAEGGRWTTRLSRRLKKYYDYKLMPKERADLGEIFNRHLTKPNYIEFHDTIDWRDGAFGDDGSCWVDNNSNIGRASTEGWWCGNIIRRHPGAYVLRMFRSEEAYKTRPWQGMGRAWAWEDNGLYIFNSRGGLYRASVSETLGKLFGLPVVPLKQVRIGWERYTENGCTYIGEGEPKNSLEWEKLEEKLWKS